MKATIDVKGGKELEAKLGALGKRATARAVARRVLKRAAQPIADAAARKAPDDPATSAPDLPSSIAVGSKQRSSTAKRNRRESRSAVVVYVGPTEDGYPQALPQEFGTKYHPAQPFMRPAWDATKMQALSFIEDELGKEIDKTAKRLAKRRKR